MSDVDFERAQTDIEDELDGESEYYEEEVTDEEAMQARARENATKDEDEDSDMGFYMPTVIAKNKPDSAEKEKPKASKTNDQLPKITKKVKKKRKRATNSGRRPPARGHNAALKNSSPTKLVLGA